MLLKKDSTHLGGVYEIFQRVDILSSSEINEAKESESPFFILTRRQTTDCFRFLYIDIAGAIIRQIAS